MSLVHNQAEAPDDGLHHGTQQDTFLLLRKRDNGGRHAKTHSSDVNCGCAKKTL